MAYKALYRTYRPNSFEEVAGQQHVVKTLQHAVEQHKIAHAYLFCGPRGTGKTSIAKIFAKMINCESTDHKPCGVCENCQAVLSGTHPDIIEIDAASNNGVEEVRSLIEKVKYAPLKGKYKVYIIDEVHMMSSGAFNALLKTIEEPPEHVIFILATTEPHKVLPTIISRCQRFDFTKVSDNEIVGRLHTILEAEHITCEDEVVRIIAQLADGGLRDALSILDQCIAYAQDDIKVHHINEIYGITTVKEKLTLFDHIFQKNALELLNIIDALIDKGIDIKRLTNDLIEILKETIIFEYTKESNLLHVLTSDEVIHITDQISIKKRFDMITLLMETYDKYRTAANAGSYFEVCLLKMLDLAASDEAVSNVQQIEQKPEPLFKKRETPISIEPTSNNVSRETLKSKPVYKMPETSPDIQDIDDGSFDFHQEVVSAPVEVKVHENKAAEPLDDEFILGLLAGANKPEKANDMKNFKRIDEYTINLKWAKYANLLKHGGIVGSGHNYVVLVVDNQAEANQINELDSNNELCEFLLELLEKSKKIFAISMDQQKRVIQAFKERMLNGTLPDPIQVQDVVVDTEKNKEKTQEEIVLDLFGKENITVMEE